jgi:dGTPase
VDTHYPGASPRVRFWELQRQLINVLIGGLIEATSAAATAAGVQDVEEVRALDHRIAKLTPQAAEINRQVRKVLVNHVYGWSELVEERRTAAAKLGELFVFLVEHPDGISPGYRESLTGAPVHRVVCDYIAGMTDGYLMRVHRELLG